MVRLGPYKRMEGQETKKRGTRDRQLASCPSAFFMRDQAALARSVLLSDSAGKHDPARSAGSITVLMHRRSLRSHLTRYTPGAAGRFQSQRWVFATLYDLPVFARAQGFREVDAEATNWWAVSGLV